MPRIDPGSSSLLYEVKCVLSARGLVYNYKVALVISLKLFVGVQQLDAVKSPIWGDINDDLLADTN